MSQPQAPEQVLDTLGDCPPGRRDEDTTEGIQCSQRMLSFSDALLSIIATVMILPVTHTEISPEQVMGQAALCVCGSEKTQGPQGLTWHRLRRQRQEAEASLERERVSKACSAYSHPGGGPGLLVGGSPLSLRPSQQRSWPPGRAGGWAPKALCQSSADKGSALEVSQRTSWKRKVPGLPQGQKVPLREGSCPSRHLT
ncbi:hypothetical protein P7K49_005793 [Saguinus oedipus]|uniref:Uncharacterized protein n=1 Tax=Saguinus oedipus TaxID=9490 RepID=A0ABQ9W0J7_SAGOE|nr:hypothetical protein P7K49_005793 [Saguinus oedipus]